MNNKLIPALIMLFTLIAAFTTISAQGLTPRPSPGAEISQMIGISKVTLNYSRPGVKGRVIWGSLVPYNEMWRTGANQNTTIEFSHPGKGQWP